MSQIREAKPIRLRIEDAGVGTLIISGDESALRELLDNAKTTACDKAEDAIRQRDAEACNQWSELLRVYTSLLGELGVLSGEADYAA